MPALQVRDFPDDLYAELKRCAAEEDRSISQQTVHILREYLKAYKRLAGRSDWMVIPKTEVQTSVLGGRRSFLSKKRILLLRYGY